MNEEIYIITKGTSKMAVGSEEVMGEAFVAVYIEPNVKHMLHNTGDEELAMIFIYAPAGIMDHWAEKLAGKMT